MRRVFTCCMAKFFLSSTLCIPVTFCQEKRAGICYLYEYLYPKGTINKISFRTEGFGLSVCLTWNGLDCMNVCVLDSSSIIPHHWSATISMKFSQNMTLESLLISSTGRLMPMIIVHSWTLQMRNFWKKMFLHLRTQKGWGFFFFLVTTFLVFKDGNNNYM